MLKIKERMKRSPLLMNLVSKIYNTVHYNNVWKYKRNNHILYSGAFMKRTAFHIKGKNNTIQIGTKARLFNCKVTIIGNNVKLIIGEGSTIVSNVHFWLQDDNSSIVIGNDFTMEGGHVAATGGKSVTIGNDCMFSGDVEIRNGDSHSIIDVATGKRTNYEKPVAIGNHVWLTAHVRVLKGSVIPSNSIVSNSSVVAAELEEENGLYGGIPCRLLKKRIDWDRNKL